MLITLIVLLAALVLGQPQPAANPSSPAAAPATQPSSAPEKVRQPTTRADGGLTRKTWTVDGQERIALLHIPADAAPAPVVFAFHGHGGNARNASMSFRMHTLWPEAIVVYMEGLPTRGALTDPDGKLNGWQNREGVENDRDLKFFDAVLTSLKADYKVDDRRIYAMGHSNGGGFTYLLWKARPDVFAAFAPSGAFTLQATSLKAKPAMHIAGKNDELVKFPFQERTMEAIRKLDGCDEKGETWAKDCTLYASKSGTPVVTMIYDGTHKYPSEAPALIVKFFKGQLKPGPEASSAKTGG